MQGPLSLICLGWRFTNCTWLNEKAPDSGDSSACLWLSCKSSGGQRVDLFSSTCHVILFYFGLQIIELNNSLKGTHSENKRQCCVFFQNIVFFCCNQQPFPRRCRVHDVRSLLIQMGKIVQISQFRNGETSVPDQNLQGWNKDRLVGRFGHYYTIFEQTPGWSGCEISPCTKTKMQLIWFRPGVICQGCKPWFSNPLGDHGLFWNPAEMAFMGRDCFVLQRCLCFIHGRRAAFLKLSP